MVDAGGPHSSGPPAAPHHRGGRRAEGVLLVEAGGDGLATDVTLTIRPLDALLAGIERMNELLAIG
ncbi:MAG TPA: hypothetical protein VGF25_16655 [Thermoleophilaceae bacterium]